MPNDHDKPNHPEHPTHPDVPPGPPTSKPPVESPRPPKHREVG